MSDRVDTELGSFARAVQESFPAHVALPDAIVAALNWLEVNGHVLSTPRGPHGSVLSPTEAAGTVGAGGAIFHPAFDFGHSWLRSDDPVVIDRLIAFVDTGADGSTAGIWIDDDGQQQFVHLGSGSGSIWSNIITDDPVDFLRLLAIGYDELCWPDDHERTPQQAYAAANPADGGVDGWVAPAEFRAWVEHTFATTIPVTARDIIGAPDDADGNRAGDPFGQWLALGR